MEKPVNIVKMAFSREAQQDKEYLKTAKTYNFRTKDKFNPGEVFMSLKYKKYLHVIECFPLLKGSGKFYSIEKDMYADSKIDPSFFALGELKIIDKVIDNIKVVS